MLLLPDKIKETLERLKLEFKFYVSLKKINGKYYLYKQTTAWNKETKKLKVFSKYLGRITDDGTFIKKEMTSDDELENAKAIVLAHGGKIILPEIQEIQNPVINLPTDEIEKKILETLSMDARVSLTVLGKGIGLTPSATYNRVKKLEEKYRIRYFAEIDIQKMGYLWYLFAVKFDDLKPSFEISKRGLETFPEIQLAFFTKGEYDLMIFFLSENNDAADALASQVMQSEAFSEHTSTWNIIPVEKHYGAIPLRNAFFDKLKQRVFIRTKSSPHKKHDQIYRREYLVLKELNDNGVIDFSEMDRKYDFDSGRARYAYHELIKKGVIVRITLTLQIFENKRLDLLFIELKNAKQFFETRAPFLYTVIDDSTPTINKYVLIGDIGTPAGIMAVIPSLEQNSLNDLQDNLSKNVKGMKLKDAIISGILVGSFCYRRIAKTSTVQYKILVENYGMKLATDKIGTKDGRTDSNEK